VFVDRLKNLAKQKGNEVLKPLVSTCFRGEALRWYSTELSELEKDLLRAATLVQWYSALIKRFKERGLVAQEALENCSYTLADARNGRAPRAYVQDIVRHVKAAELPLYNQFIISSEFTFRTASTLPGAREARGFRKPRIPVLVSNFSNFLMILDPFLLVVVVAIPSRKSITTLRQYKCLPATVRVWSELSTISAIPGKLTLSTTKCAIPISSLFATKQSAAADHRIKRVRFTEEEEIKNTGHNHGSKGTRHGREMVDAPRWRLTRHPLPMKTLRNQKTQVWNSLYQRLRTSMATKTSSVITTITESLRNKVTRATTTKNPS